MKPTCDEITIGDVQLGHNYPLRLENILADTKDGDIRIYIPAKTGKYKVDIIPIQEKS